MGTYTTGKYANGTCDRCGFVYKLNSLKQLVVNMSQTGLLVCRECWEEDHPQYQVGRYPVFDPQAVANPRPDTPPEED